MKNVIYLIDKILVDVKKLIPYCEKIIKENQDYDEKAKALFKKKSFEDKIEEFERAKKILNTVKDCENCNGLGYYSKELDGELFDCEKCNGLGFVI